MMKELAFHVQCSSLTPAGEVWSSLRRVAAGEGAEARGLQSGVVAMCSSARVYLWAKARRPAALPTPGGLGRYWAAQWHLTRAVGKSASGGAAQSASMFTGS